MALHEGASQAKALMKCTCRSQSRATNVELPLKAPWIFHNIIIPWEEAPLFDKSFQEGSKKPEASGASS
jgi:hypothetical protein